MMTVCLSERLSADREDKDKDQDLPGFTPQVE